jgi:hypothetical protein
MALKFTIDTNRYWDFCDGIEETVSLFRKAESIAALAAQHGLLLYTRDSRFEKLPQLPILA